MNKSSTEIVKTPKQLMKEKLQACGSHCTPHTLRAAKSAYVVYFRDKYLESLGEWKKAYDNRGMELLRSVQNPGDRTPKDKKLESIFNDGKFLSNVEPNKESNDAVINECMELVENLLGDEGNLKSDHRYNTLKYALKYRTQLLGHVFTDLEANIQTRGAKVQQLQAPDQGKLIEREPLKAALESLIVDTDAAYEMGVKAGKLKKGGDEKKKYRNAKIAGFIKKDFISQESQEQHMNYIGKTRARFIAFQEEYVQRALLKRTGDEVPAEAKYPTACDLELEHPEGSLLDFLNAECLTGVLFDLNLDELPDIKVFYDEVRVLGELCASLYVGLNEQLKALKAPSYPEYYFRYKAIRKCINELCQLVSSDPAGILKQCMPAKFDDEVSRLSLSIISKIDAKLKEYWTAIHSSTHAWELAAGKIEDSVNACKKAQRELSLIVTSEMFEEVQIRTSLENFQAECTRRVGVVIEGRRRAITSLSDKLEKAIKWETVDSIVGFSTIEGEIIYEKDELSIQKKGAISEEEYKDRLQELAAILRIDFSIEYRNEFDALKKRFDEVKSQRTMILEKKREVAKFIAEVATGKDEEIAQKCLDCFNWLVQWNPQSVSQMFDKKFADLFWVQVYLNIGFGEFAKAVAARVEGPFNKIERAVCELCFQRVEQVGDKVVEKMPRPLTKDALEKTIAQAKEQIEKLKQMAIGNVYQILNQAKDWFPNEDVKAVLKQITGKAPDEEVKARLNHFEEKIAGRRKAIGDLIILMLEARIASLGTGQKELNTGAMYTMVPLKGAIDRTKKFAELEVELHKKIQELIDTVGCQDLDAVMEKLNVYNATMEQYQSMRDIPRKVEEMNQRLKAIDTELNACKLENFGDLSARVAAERAMVDEDKNIPLKWVTLEDTERRLQSKKQALEKEVMAKITQLTKEILAQLDAEIKKSNGNFEQIKQGLIDLEKISVTASQQGLTLSTDQIKVYLEHAQKKIIEILNAHISKTTSVLNVEAGSLSSDVYKANRQYFEKEIQFAEKMKVICQKSGLGKAYAQYEGNLTRALIDFNDQEQECLFFETIKTFDTFRYLTLDTMSSSEVQQYGEKFQKLLTILNARLDFQAQSGNPRNLNDCFSAFDAAIPNPPESETASEELKGIPAFLEGLLEPCRKRQMENFKTKIMAAVRAKDFTLAEKLLSRLDPKGVEMSESWGFYVYSVIERLSNDRTLTHEDRQAQNMNCIRATLIKMGSCTAEQRVDFCNFILGPLAQMPLTRDTVDLEALILLLRISEDARSRKGWFFWPDGIGEIASYLPDPLAIMLVMQQFLEGQMVDGEESAGNWCRSRLLYVNSLVKPQLEKGTESRSEKSIAFLQETRAAYDNYCRKDGAAPAREKAPVLARGGLLARRKVAATAPPENPTTAVQTGPNLQGRNVGLGAFFTGAGSNGTVIPVTDNRREPSQGQQDEGSVSVAGFINSRYGNEGAPSVVQGVVQAPTEIFQTGAAFFSRVFSPEARGAFPPRQQVQPEQLGEPGALMASLYGQNPRAAVQPKPHQDDEYTSDGFGTANGFTAQSNK